MFTGIIDHIGTITQAEQTGDLRIKIATAFTNFRLGESIACNGACLTVVESGAGFFEAELSAETVACTAPGQWAQGLGVNLERALKAGDALDGHIVTGHVDGIGTIRSVSASGDSHILEIEVSQELKKFIAAKGSVCIDGVSLTVNKVEDARFWVNIIPHTWARTTLGQRNSGDQVNIEIDTIARYVARLLHA